MIRRNANIAPSPLRGEGWGEGENACDGPVAKQVGKRYAVRITDHVKSTIQNPNDPVAKQYVPDLRELKILPDELTDPIGDKPHEAVKGVIHRYPDRVLLQLAYVCAVYCRYCFRREKVGPGSEILKPDERSKALDYIRGDKNIWEVILSGGDPLILSPRQLKETIDTLCDIDHVQVIRIHTRVPVADPARITEELCEVLNRDKAVYIVLHINHAQELTHEVKTAARLLQQAGCLLLSQSVLLKGVNDDAKTLEELFRALAALKIKPYYLHHPDKAPGTSHFRLPLKKGRDIMKQLLGRVSGICQPHYMLDIPGGHGKIPVGPSYVEELPETGYRLEDYNGKKHRYTDG